MGEELNAEDRAFYIDAIQGLPAPWARYCQSADTLSPVRLKHLTKRRCAWEGAC